MSLLKAQALLWVASWFFQGVKFYERSTSAKFAEFKYLEKTNYTVAMPFQNTAPFHSLL